VRRGPWEADVPIWRLICSRAQRAVSRVRLKKSWLERVSLVMAVRKSSRKNSLNWPLGKASARSLRHVSKLGRHDEFTLSGCERTFTPGDNVLALKVQEEVRQMTYPITPQDDLSKASVRLVSWYMIRRSWNIESIYGISSSAIDSQRRRRET
jgi:hypothetical protein